MRRVLLTLLLLVSVCCSLSAQFRSTRNDVALQTTGGTVMGPPGADNGVASQTDTTAVTDSVQGFSIRRLVRGYARRDTLTPGYLALGTAIIPGASQMYNRDWWKVPVIYAGIGAGVYGGIYYNRQYQHTGETKYKYLRTASYIAAGAVYWGQILDGVACFKTDFRVPVPAKSTIYSLLLPGLGQANNGDYWKIPIWTGGLIACGYFYHFNDMQYRRFRFITVAGANPETSGYVGGITASQAETYRDTYRRYRDYSILAAILVYTLNVIDANVFAFMHDFDVSDNLAWIEVQPTVIQPLNPQYTWYDTSSSASGTNPALGLQLQLTF
ncbi:MAG: hypothetical protein IKH40_05490 [Bacteroidales bacterium]|nr:hypothetical protein [Bacteroidales bacterium]